VKTSEAIKHIKWDSLQTFVADVNRDKRSDIVVVERNVYKTLSVRTFLSKGDGSYSLVIDQFTDGEEVDGFEAVIADVNGDQRSDIVFRIQHPTKGLIVRIKKSKGDGTYASQEFELGDGVSGSSMRLLTGQYNKDMKTDLAKLHLNNGGVVIRTKLSNGNPSFSHNEYVAAAPGSFIDSLSGSLRWNGGATFKRFSRTGPIGNAVLDTIERDVSIPVSSGVKKLKDKARVEVLKKTTIAPGLKKNGKALKMSEPMKRPTDRR
jgi:hypothetical protein